MRRLKRVSVDEAGLWFGSANQEHSEFVSWAQITRVEAFSHPDPDAVYIHGKSGLRLLVGDRRFFIYEHIGNFDCLSKKVRSNASLA